MFHRYSLAYRRGLWFPIFIYLKVTRKVYEFFRRDFMFGDNSSKESDMRKNSFVNG